MKAEAIARVAVTAIVAMSAIATPQSVRQTDTSILGCVLLYREGRVSPAIGGLRKILAPVESTRQVGLPSPVMDWARGAHGKREVRLLEAALMLSTETYFELQRESGMAPDMFEMMSTGRPYRALIGLLHGLLTSIEPATPFLRVWYLLWESHRQAWAAPPADPDYLMIGLRAFPTDGELLLALGARHELYWWTNDGNPQRHPEGKGSAGVRHLRSAETALRKSVAAKPPLLESQLRLGHVLFALGEDKDAEEALQPTIAAINDPATRYMGQLFLGEILERRGDRAGAAAAFATAMTLVPVPQSARLAAARLDYVEGRRDEAADMVAKAFSIDKDGADPWWWYTRGVWWRHENALAEARVRVRQ